MELEKIKKYRDRIERRIQKCKEMIELYDKNKNSLSIHGYWSLGYYTGINNELENLLDDIDKFYQI